MISKEGINVDHEEVESGLARERPEMVTET